jgi:CRP/FNR family transcriptional regulator, cyclic AMP receptor protein
MDADELAFLRAVPCFQGLPTDDLLQVYRCARGRDLHAGEIIVRAGQRTDTLYVVRRGSVRLVTTAGGAERVLAVQGPGTTFNEAAACDGGPALATAQSLSAGTCIDEVPASFLSHPLATNPRLARDVVHVLAGHLRQLATLVDDLSRAMVLARPQRTARRCFTVPTPRIAPLIACCLRPSSYGPDINGQHQAEPG